MEEIKKQVEALQQTVTTQSAEIADLREHLLKLRRSLLLPAYINALGGNGNLSSEFENCKLLLDSPYWPAAVDPSLICNVSSDQDKEDRAEGVLDFIVDMPLENLKFLDFGCGEGHIVNRSKLQKTKMSVGYESEPFEKWKEWTAEPNVKFTTDWEDVKNNGPYNAILLYDVIDHIKGDETTFNAELCKIKSVLAPYGKVYVRCHPWCSRHGTHLYHKINKAYIHLVFSEEELAQMGYEGLWTKHVIHTIPDYERMFHSAHFHILRGAQIQSEAVEPFFNDTFIIANRIKRHWPHWDNLRLGLTHQFVDYVLG